MSLIAGWPGIAPTHFLAGVLPAAEHGGEGHGALFAEALAIAAALGGLALGFAIYQKGLADPDRLAARWPRLYRLSYNKFYVDEIYGALIVRPLLAIARGALRFDLSVIDGMVNGFGDIARGSGSAFARLQSGRVRDYLLFMSLGVTAVLGVWLWW
jgi:NADH-quinone oxidoreductase subunit L